MVFVNLPSRKRPRLIWATPLLAALAVASFLWLLFAHDDPSRMAAWMRWGTLSAPPAEWRLLRNLRQDVLMLFGRHFGDVPQLLLRSAWQ